MKNYLNSIIIFIIFSVSLNIEAQNTTNVFVSAHPDDWQLFMNPNAYNSVKTPNEKVVFIHTTAGDAGQGTGNNNYYLAREEGSLRAIRFMSNTFGSGAGLGTNMNQTTVTINGHDILKFTYRNIVSYFLRLPDGNPGGGGYALHNFTSLQKLYNGTASSISAVDNSTSYSSLADLQTTLQQIVILESDPPGTITFNIADNDSSINPGDHSDHIYSSLIMQNVANMIGGITMNLYTEYSTSSKAQNVTGDDYLVSAGTWGATASGLSDNFHSSTWDNGHNAWIGKQYVRTISSGNTNIALQKPTTSSSNEPGYVSSNAVDNNYSNWWGASPHPEWWQVDLEDVYDLNKIVVTNYHDGTRYYQYDIQASVDGSNWTTIVDFNNNTTPATSSGNTFNLNNPSARYLRVNMNYNSANIGVHIMEFEAYGELTSSNPNNNIALQKPTTSSSNEPGRISSNAVDNNYSLNNWWGANPYPEWWQVDLEDIYNLTKIIMTNYYDGTRYYQYDIQGSLDGTNWTTIVDFNNNTTPATSQGNTFGLDNPSARYLRVNMNYNSANIGVHIIEFEAYGELTSSNSNRNVALRNTANLPVKMKKDYFLSMYPNPNKSGKQMILELELPKNSNISVEIYNSGGNKILKKLLDLTKGSHTIEIPTLSFSKGMYIVKVNNDGEIKTKKIFIE